MTWDAARKHCEADDANLVSIRTEWTQAYIELLALNLNRSLWIGLNKAKVWIRLFKLNCGIESLQFKFVNPEKIASVTSIYYLVFWQFSHRTAMKHFELINN